MSLVLDPRHERIVRDILRKRLPGRRVLVFGSRARGEAVAHSDLDLLVEDAGADDQRLLAQLDADFDESDLPFRVEVIEGALLDPGFRRRIEAELLLLEPAPA